MQCSEVNCFNNADKSLHPALEAIFKSFKYLNAILSDNGVGFQSGFGKNQSLTT